MKNSKRILYNFIYTAGSFFFIFKKNKVDRKSVHKILVNSLYFRGDVLFHTPVFKVLRLIFPYAEIHVWVKSRAYELVSTNTNIDKVIVFDNLKTSGYGEDNKIDAKKKIHFISQIRRERYDLYVDLTGKYSTALIASLGNFEFSIGLNYNGFGFCYNKYFKINTQETRGHLIDKYLELIRYGLDIESEYWAELIRKCSLKPEINLTQYWVGTAKKELEKRNISPKKILICIHTTAGWKEKQWGADKFALLFDILINRMQYQTIIVGDGNDTQYIEEISGFFRKKSFLDLTEMFIPLPLMGTAGLISLCDVFVGADSVPLHISSALNKPSVALFGPTNPEFSKPRNENSITIYKTLHCSSKIDKQYCSKNAGRTCDFIECMNRISVEEVVEKIVYLLNNFSNKVDHSEK